MIYQPLTAINRKPPKEAAETKTFKLKIFGKALNMYSGLFSILYIMGDHNFILSQFIRNLLLTVIAVSLVGGCKDRFPEAEVPQSIPPDSVLIWTAISLDNSNSPTRKRNVLDKALRYTQSLPNDSIKLKYISKIQWAYLMLDDSLAFRKTNAEARNVARVVGDTANWARRFWDLAYFFEREYVKDSAYYHYAQAQQLSSAIDDPLQAGKFLYFMAQIQEEVNDNAGSEANIIRALELLKPLDANKEIYNCYNLLGVLASNVEDYDRALEHYHTARSYHQKIVGPHDSESTEINNIGVVYMRMGEYDKAIPYFEQLIESEELKKNDPDHYARVLNNLALSKLRSGETTNVEPQLLESLRIRDSLGDMMFVASSHYSMAEYYLASQENNRALFHGLKAREYAEQSESNDRLLETLQLLIRINPEGATNYSQEYIVLSDSLQLEERKLRDKFARIRFETDEVVAENQLLARQRQLWTGIAAAILLLSIAGAVIFIQRGKNQKLKFQQQQQANNQEILDLLLSQGEKLQEGKQIEQKRISEELHDGVQGRLQGARMMLLGLNKRDDDDAKSERARAIVMLKDIQEEVRSISHELSHAAYQKIHNFILSLEDLKTTIAKSAGISIDFYHSEHVDWDALSSDIKINLYRMIQESLQNAVKHAQCTQIDLRLEADTTEIRARISDNGKGFVVRKGKKGIGMRNIASRTAKVNGTWAITSEVGKGTVVSLTIPIIEKESVKATRAAKNLQDV